MQHWEQQTWPAKGHGDSSSGRVSLKQSENPSWSLDNLRTNQILPPHNQFLRKKKKKKKDNCVRKTNALNNYPYWKIDQNMFVLKKKTSVSQSVTPVFQAPLLLGCPYSHWGPSTAQELSVFSLLENSSQVGKFHLWFHCVSPCVFLHGVCSA